MGTRFGTVRSDGIGNHRAREKREYSLAADFVIATNWQPSNKMRSHTVRLPVLAKNAKNGKKHWQCSVLWDWQPSSSKKTRVLIGNRLWHFNTLATVEQNTITTLPLPLLWKKKVLASFGAMGLATVAQYTIAYFAASMK